MAERVSRRTRAREGLSVPAQPIGIFQAKTHLSELVDKVQRGERFTITKHGRPVAELGPVESSVVRPRRGMARSESFYMAPDFDAPLDDFADYGR